MAPNVSQGFAVGEVVLLELAPLELPPLDEPAIVPDRLAGADVPPVALEGLGCRDEPPEAEVLLDVPAVPPAPAASGSTGS